jgi:hypothetical protein
MIGKEGRDMNKHQLTKTVLTLGALCLLTVFALAHDEDRSHRQPAYQAGYDRGYSFGYGHGQFDRDHRSGYDFNCREYRKADYGYHRSYGDLGRYREGFRAAFLSGYQDGFYGRGIRSGFVGTIGYRERGSGFRGEFGFGYSSSGGGYSRGSGDRYGHAFEMGRQNGFEKGLEKGRKDYDKGRSFDLNRHDAYQDADDRYRSAYGNKAVYRDGFRRGFEEGYREGFGYGRYSRY